FVLRRADTGELRLDLSPDGTFNLSGSVKNGRAWVTRDEIAKSFKPQGQWNRLSANVRGDNLKVTLNGQVVKEQKINEFPAKGAFELVPRDEMDYGNLFVRELGK